ncbi:MAG: exosortase/archaeosortase family protein [Verrucomicrobia bacterium]|nr:exosortase/archaeosortase family protein [Verrucomicrobiota bacterium]
MDLAVHRRQPDRTGYVLMGVLLAMLAVSFYEQWYWCSESWFRMGLLGEGDNAGYSPGPLVPILVLLMLSTRLRRVTPTPELAKEDLFHAAYMKLIHPVVVRVVAFWQSFRGAKSNAEELQKLAYGRRAVAVWVVWLLLAALTAVTLSSEPSGVTAKPPYELSRPGWMLLFVEIVLFGAAVMYVAWRLFRGDAETVAAARHPGHVVAGAIILVGSLLAHFGAVRGLMPQVSIVAFMGSLIGLLWMLYGWRVVRVLVFPLLFMVLTIPMDWVEMHVGLPAQIFATKYSVAIMQFIGLNVEIVGRTAFDVIRAGQHVDFKVDAPCSGLKSLVALTAISATYGYLTQKTTLKVVIIMACGPFLAIITNIIRLVAVGVTAHFFDRTAAMWVHDHALPIYILAILFLMLIDKALNSKWLKIEDF